jgi:succinate-semialdehyde dehydrogenase/glutarate-semialdehyde dehydrogenase
MAATADEARLVAEVPGKLYIGGRWRDGGDGGTLRVEDPATGQTLAEVADATAADAGRTSRRS